MGGKEKGPDSGEKDMVRPEADTLYDIKVPEDILATLAETVGASASLTEALEDPEALKKKAEHVTGDTAVPVVESSDDGETPVAAPAVSIVQPSLTEAVAKIVKEDTAADAADDDAKAHDTAPTAVPVVESSDHDDNLEAPTVSAAAAQTAIQDVVEVEVDEEEDDSSEVIEAGSVEEEEGEGEEAGFDGQASGLVQMKDLTPAPAQPRNATPPAEEKSGLTRMEDLTGHPAPSRTETPPPAIDMNIAKTSPPPMPMPTPEPVAPDVTAEIIYEPTDEQDLNASDFDEEPTAQFKRPTAKRRWPAKIAGAALVAGGIATCAGVGTLIQANKDAIATQLSALVPEKTYDPSLPLPPEDTDKPEQSEEPEEVEVPEVTYTAYFTYSCLKARGKRKGVKEGSATCEASDGSKCSLEKVEEFENIMTGEEGSLLVNWVNPITWEQISGYEPFAIAPKDNCKRNPGDSFKIKLIPLELN